MEVLLPVLLILIMKLNKLNSCNINWKVIENKDWNNHYRVSNECVDLIQVLFVHIKLYMHF